MQIEKASSLFKSIFGTLPGGIWLPERAINDAALKEFEAYSWKWTISEADNSSCLGIDTKKGLLTKFKSYRVDGVTVFFRDKYLSDGIGFRYSGKTVDDALNDFTNTLLNMGK